MKKHNSTNISPFMLLLVLLTVPLDQDFNYMVRYGYKLMKFYFIVT